METFSVTREDLLETGRWHGCDIATWSDAFVDWLLALCNSPIKVPVPWKGQDETDYYNYLQRYLKPF